MVETKTNGIRHSKLHLTLRFFYRIEFPYPKETPFKDKTVTIKDTNNPEYNHKIMIPINIKEKACQRVFKRGVAKVEVMSKGGFLRGDTLLGTASGKIPFSYICAFVRIKDWL